MSQDGNLPSTSEIIDIFKRNDPTAKEDLLKRFPNSTFIETAKKYLSQPYPEVNLGGLNILAETYSRGVNSKFGVNLSKAVFELSKHSLATSFEKELYDAYLFCAGNSLNSWLLGLNTLGQYQDAVRVGEEGLEWLKKNLNKLKKNLNEELQKQSQEHQCMLLLSIIEAYIGLSYTKEEKSDDSLTKVKTLLDTTNWNFLKGSYKTKLNQLWQQYNQLVQDATNLATYPKSDEELKEKEDKEKQERERAIKNQDVANKIVKLISETNKNKAHKIQLQKQIRNACLIFADSVKGRDLELIKKSRDELKEARDIARQNNFIEDENDALWGLYLCYSRSQQEDLAIDVLQSLRCNLELLRNSIKDPMKGAGVFLKFPYLFASLCQLLCRAKRSEELLNAIEGAKGRVLADVLTESQGEIVEDSAFSKPVNDLRKLMPQVHAHYISYFVDDDSTYAVLVAKDGSVHSHEIALGKKELRKLFESHPIDPQDWGKRLNFNKKIPKDLPDKLSLLVNWLEQFAREGLIRQNDHICYCPDDELHLVPLHYVTFLNEPLVKYVSLSRIHSASALISILKRPLEYYSHAVAVQVPYEYEKQQSQEGERYYSKLQQLDRRTDWLLNNLPTQVLKEEVADLPALKNLSLSNKIIHFSTHGIFPENKNPYTNSGLMLASEGKLPNLENTEAKILDNAYKKHLLTPKKILDKDTNQSLNFSESHISIMACVTGLAKEGIGKDALGLEWAFLLAGANSLLSTHWDVDTTATTEFILGFYDKWLNQRFPRFAAWRETVVELMNNEQWSSQEHCSTYYWAAFSLSGDWR